MLYLDVQYLRLISSSFRNFKQKSTRLFNVSCHLCGDSKTHSTKARGYFYARGDQLNYRCFNCNASTTFAKILQDINEDLYKEYLLEKFQSKRIVIPKPIPVLKFGSFTKKTIYENCIWCNELEETHFCVEYLKHRKIPASCYSLLGYAEDFSKFAQEVIPNLNKTVFAEPRLIIPFYNEYNELLGISGRALNASKLRYVHLKVNEHNKLIYGIERLKKKERIYIVEGQLDSLFLKNCLAAGNADLVSVATDLTLDNVVMIWDNENRNSNIVRNMENALKKNYSIVIWNDSWKYKDINEAIIAGENINSLMTTIENNIYSGPSGLLRLNFWKKT